MYVRESKYCLYLMIPSSSSSLSSSSFQLFKMNLLDQTCEKIISFLINTLGSAFNHSSHSSLNQQTSHYYWLTDWLTDNETKCFDIGRSMGNFEVRKRAYECHNWYLTYTSDLKIKLNHFSYVNLWSSWNGSNNSKLRYQLFYIILMLSKKYI